MTYDFFKAILILPGTALVYVPGLILWLSAGTRYGAGFPLDSVMNWIAGLLLALAGLTLGIWSMRLFAAQNSGTPAPWQPIPNFIAAGPYRHMRNPMLTGVILLLLGLSLILSSWGLFIWAALFFVLNTLYFKFSEEPQLRRRFGKTYTHYHAHVPRWWPRLTPYEPDQPAGK